MRPYSPGGTFNALATPRTGSIPPTANVHRLGLGLPGYLICLLPQLSCLSVRNCPETRLRHWCSSRYLRISLLHREFQSPLQSSSDVVSDDLSGLGPELSHQTYATTYAPFTPSESEQRLGPLYYRGCWHRVSRPFLFRYYQSSRLFTCSLCSRMTGVYEPKPFIPHAASLHQGCPHCERFSTAATRRCLDRVSVPVWLVVLSDQLPVIALVGRYLTN